MLLSICTQRFYRTERPALVTWCPKVTEMIEFGQKTYSWDEVNYHLERLPRNKSIDLTQINYKESKQRLCGLQLIFTNDIKTPLFEGNKAKGEYLEPIPVDNKKAIRSISMKIVDGYRLQGLRFGHGENDYTEIQWDKREGGEWETREIPKGHRIIGLKCSAKKHTVV